MSARLVDQIDEETLKKKEYGIFKTETGLLYYPIHKATITERARFKYTSFLWFKRIALEGIDVKFAG